MTLTFTGWAPFLSLIPKSAHEAEQTEAFEEKASTSSGTMVLQYEYRFHTFRSLLFVSYACAGSSIGTAGCGAAQNV